MLRKLSISSFRFFAAGKGLSVRTGQYLGEAILVGAVTGIVVVGFRYLIGLGDEWLLNGVGRMFIGGLVILPAVGATIGHFLIRCFDKLEHARGTDSAIRAYHQDNGYITSTVVPIKSVASVLTVGCGGSGGYEGPVTLIGAACGSAIARMMNLSVRARRILMAAGLAAGIGALFQAPLAGALFGFEIFYSSSDVEYETLLPSCVASAVSYTVFAYFFGWQPLFRMPADYAYENGLRLLPYFVLAVVVTFGARFYITFFGWTEKMFAAVTLPGWVKVAFGGLLTGLVGLAIPGVQGTSYPIVQACFDAGRGAPVEGFGALTAVAFVAFFFAKVLATSFTVGSGGSAGVFAPALVCGGSLGAATGLFFAHILPPSWGIHPAAFGLVGMAGFLASAVRVPMTAIVIVSEISGNHALLLPAMWVCGIAFWLNNGWTLYRSQPHNRESSPVHR